MPVNRVTARLNSWPWPPALDEAPSVEDAQTAPAAEAMLPQVLQLAPRGAAWGTDEARARDGVSPVMAQYWTAIAAWTADLNAAESATAAQAFPSLVDEAGIAAWEAELGIDEPAATLAARQATVRMRAHGIGGAAPADFIRLAWLGGATITIEEPDQFRVGSSELGPSFDEDPPSDEDLAELDMVSDEDAWSVFLVRIEDLGPFGSNNGLARALEPFVPLHVKMVVADEI